MTTPANFALLTATIKGVRHLLVYSAYNAEFIAAIKATGAKFADFGERKGWYLPVDSASADAFREICGDYRRAAVAAPKAASAPIAPRSTDTRPWAGSSVSGAEYARLAGDIGPAYARAMADVMRG